MAFLIKLPFLVILSGLGAIAMMVPMAHAIRIGDFFTARVFLHSGILFFLLTGLVAIATANYQPRITARSHLIALLGAFLVLPVILAYPLYFLIPGVSYFQLYFEMVSSLTTTGATVFEDPARLSEPVHLWRAFVGLLGGFLMLVSAVAIFAPLNLGGFEVYSAGPTNGRARGLARIKAADVSERLVSYALKFAPIYFGATALLAFLLLLSGERAFIAVIHAMSTLSTSGIVAREGLAGSSGGFVEEILIFLFLFFAVSRIMFTTDRSALTLKSLWQDYEVRLMLFFLTVLPVLLFMRHWYGAFEVNDQENAPAALLALWGSVFTTLSFLTTTGFESAHWSAAQNWSGLHTPGIILIGLAVMGGGVATTAGGIKLLRVYALYKHGMREMQKLSFPSSIGGAGKVARHIRREGAYIAWLFFMLFAISTAGIMVGLSLTGLNFEQSLTFAVSALSTTGPLASAVLENGADYALLDDAARGILCLAMVIGRLETLAIIALLNPEFWRP